MLNQFPKTIFTLFLCAIFTFSAAAQTTVTDRVKRRAENRANQRANQKIDQGVDKTLDKIEGLFRKKSDTPEQDESIPEGEPIEEQDEEITEDQESQPSGGMGNFSLMGGNFEPYENPVKMNLTMDITTVDKKGKTTNATVDYTFDTWATAMIMTSEEGSVRMILDNKEGYQTIITEDKGEVQAFRMRQRSIDVSSFVPDESEFTVTETGNTRSIDGYHCKEFLIEHPDGNTTSWVTEDIDIDMMAISQALASQGRNKKMPTQNYFNMTGFPVESTSVSKNGKETTTTHFRNVVFGDKINLDAFDTTGIEIMSMGF